MIFGVVLSFVYIYIAILMHHIVALEFRHFGHFGPLTLGTFEFLKIFQSQRISSPDLIYDHDTNMKNSKDPCHYDTLGVDEYASESEIKKAFRKKVRLLVSFEKRYI